jgi:hypothetical protein
MLRTKKLILQNLRISIVILHRLSKDWTSVFLQALLHQLRVNNDEFLPNHFQFGKGKQDLFVLEDIGRQYMHQKRQKM